MDQLKVGDLVLVGKDVLRANLSSFGHSDPDSKGYFLHIETDLGFLEISKGSHDFCILYKSATDTNCPFANDRQRI
jgi:hypothetical protein